MKAKLLAAALVLTSAALASELPASASILCPPDSCFTLAQDCVNDGGAPVPQSTGETCYTLPTHDEYPVNILYCYKGGVPAYFDECYSG
jgi:hypothetical protein